MSINYGLEGITALLSALHHPERDFLALHVAGTNGKGSVCCLLESALIEGLRPSLVGKFVSPYLCEPRDGVSINGTPLARDEWEAVQGEVEAASGRCEGGVTPFEKWTACAFLAFSRQRVAVAVVEVGVGGGGDATNALPPPLLALLTPLAMDHVDLLGPTLEDIAGHKAGIVKRGGGGVITAPGQDPSALGVFQRKAAAEGMELVVAPTLTWLRRGVLRVPLEGHGGEGSGEVGSFGELPCGLAGEFQAQNAALAWCALSACAKQWPALASLPVIARAWEKARWRGRAERVTLEYLPTTSSTTAHTPMAVHCMLDGGHNPHAMRVIGEELAYHFGSGEAGGMNQGGGGGGGARRVALLFTCGSTRDPKENLTLLLTPLMASLAASPPLHVALFPVPFSTPSGMPWVKPHTSEVIGKVGEEVLLNFKEGCAADVVPAFSYEVAPCSSLKEALGRVVAGGFSATAICGSLYLVSDVYREYLI